MTERTLAFDRPERHDWISNSRDVPTVQAVAVTTYTEAITQTTTTKHTYENLQEV